MVSPARYARASGRGLVGDLQQGLTGTLRHPDPGAPSSHRTNMPTAPVPPGEHVPKHRQSRTFNRALGDGGEPNGPIVRSHLGTSDRGIQTSLQIYKNLAEPFWDRTTTDPIRIRLTSECIGKFNC